MTINHTWLLEEVGEAGVSVGAWSM